MPTDHSSRRAEPIYVVLLVVACAAVIGVVFIYRMQFNGPLSADAEKWGQFGDYLGGTLNPILGFISVVALVLTLAVQARQLNISQQQLQLSRQELEATRQELIRTADAQQATAKALTLQASFAVKTARLSALGAALKVVDQELARIGRNFAEERTRNEYREAERRRNELVQELNQLLTDLRANSAV